MNRPDCYSAAIHYALRGWFVLPLNEGSKTPATTNGYKSATNDTDELHNWYANGSYNVGIATGASGLVVIDVDGLVGTAALAELCAGRPFPNTYTVKTRTEHGRHYYFRAPEGRLIRCSAGRLGKGLDVRAEGGYVVAPPSWVDADHKGPAGSYSVLVDLPPANLPDWLEKLLVQQPCSTKPQRSALTSLSFPTRPETPRQIAILRDRLLCISADCSYEIYRNVVWAILSTGWGCAEQVALDWSLTALHRFEQKTFDDLVRTYDPTRPGSVSYGLSCTCPDGEATVSSPAAPATLTPLQHLQLRFAIADIDGELRILDLAQLAAVQSGVTTASLGFYGRADGALKMTRALEAIPQRSSPKTVIDQFWKDPTTQVFDRIAFTPLVTGPTTINLWVPPTVQPAQGGSWERIASFLFDVICSADKGLYKYLVRYLAHMLQKPEQKPGILIVLLGGQGTGKGTFLRLLMRIWSRTTLLVSDVNQIVGTFNAALERHYVICMDEALFSGDKKAIERLKSLVTEPVIHIEQKYQPSHSIDSFHRFFATSNNDHFGQVDSDDRRFVFVRVSDAHKTDSQYFDALHADIEDDACMGAMVHDLLNLKISNYNPRRRPTTREHIKQKLQSLSGFDRYWYERLCMAQSPCEMSERAWVEGFIATGAIKEGYKKHDSQAERYRPLQDDHIAERLSRMCPSAERSRITVQGRKQRGYIIPALSVARKEFESHIGSPISWDPSAIPDEMFRLPPDQIEPTDDGLMNERIERVIAGKHECGPPRPSLS